MFSSSLFFNFSSQVGFGEWGERIGGKPTNHLAYGFCLALKRWKLAEIVQPANSHPFFTFLARAVTAAE